jgi:limonene-1,2-epoxide hydrolase
MGLANQAAPRHNLPMTRSQFLMTGAAFAIPAIPAMAAERTVAEEANLLLVTNFCAAFAARDMTKIASYLAPNCAYRITETAMPAVGAAAVERIRSYVEQSSKIEFKILDSWARGPMVINERIDSFVRADASPAYHLVGVFFLKDGKIAEWTDYGIRG